MMASDHMIPVVEDHERPQIVTPMCSYLNNKFMQVCFILDTSMLLTTYCCVSVGNGEQRV